MEISEDLLCLFTAEVTEMEDSYQLTVPDRGDRSWRRFQRDDVWYVVHANILSLIKFTHIKFKIALNNTVGV